MTPRKAGELQQQLLAASLVVGRILGGHDDRAEAAPAANGAGFGGNGSGGVRGSLAYGDPALEIKPAAALGGGSAGVKPAAAAALSQSSDGPLRLPSLTLPTLPSQQAAAKRAAASASAVELPTAAARSPAGAAAAGAARSPVRSPGRGEAAQDGAAAEVQVLRHLHLQLLQAIQVRVLPPVDRSGMAIVDAS